MELCYFSHLTEAFLSQQPHQQEEEDFTLLLINLSPDCYLELQLSTADEETCIGNWLLGSLLLRKRQCSQPETVAYSSVSSSAAVMVMKEMESAVKLQLTYDNLKGFSRQSVV